MKPFYFNGYHEIKSLDELKVILDVLITSDNDRLFPILPNDLKTLKIMRFIHQRYPLIQQIQYATNIIPPVFSSLAYSVFNIPNIAKLLLKRIIFSCFFPKVNLLLAGSKKNVEYLHKSGVLGKYTKIVHAHTMDIENIISTCTSMENNNEIEKYIVYIDTSVADASDYITLDIKHTIDKKSYYKKLFDFLTFLENEYNLKVIIAAHPTSLLLTENEGEFNGFSYYKYKTNTLVKYCEFCICEATTAISYPIIYHKPFIFFMMTEVLFFESYAKSFANSTRKKLIYIDKTVSLKEEIDLELENTSGYENYLLDYLIYEKSDVFDKKSIWNVLVSILDK
ncbi:MAG TPA: hypothetical protein PLM93_08880 [Sulfuricurvum sp.]|nr:hypothetical protein [Sulfuricurvum sp.]HQT37257.1 hypothetical protein [Sulfuricurvum sp.]